MLSSAHYNLSDDNSCIAYFIQSGDLNNTAAGLDPSGLQDNGGPTKTVALLSTSPAVNAIPVSPTNYCTLVDGTTPVTTDQRGVSRPQGAACDIGAYELIVAAPSPSPTPALPKAGRSSPAGPGAGPGLLLILVAALLTPLAVRMARRRYPDDVRVR